MMLTYRELHSWDLPPREAAALQKELRSRMEIRPLDPDTIATVAGSDLSFNKGSNEVFAGFVTLGLPGLTIVDRSGLKTGATFPYVPGLLSFREIPPLLKAWQQLSARPEALIVDGHGYAHPRRFGIACHLGLLLDLPTIGCGKRILVGKHEPVGTEPGNWGPLVDHGEMIGAALRLKRGVNPIYISVGHRCDLESAIALVCRCAGPTRVPETTRQAHLYVNALRRANGE